VARKIIKEIKDTTEMRVMKFSLNIVTIMLPLAEVSLLKEIHDYQSDLFTRIDYKERI
jgi:hypothetical protein